MDALLEDDVESFVGKYSTEIERGHVYVDESGEAQALVLAQVEVAKGTIRYSDGGFSYNADNKPLG